MKFYNLWARPATGVRYAIKNGKLLTSHRYNHLPLLPSGPGGVQRELVV